MRRIQVRAWHSSQHSEHISEDVSTDGDSSCCKLGLGGSKIAANPVALVLFLETPPCPVQDGWDTFFKGGSAVCTSIELEHFCKFTVLSFSLVPQASSHNLSEKITFFNISNLYCKCSHTFDKNKTRLLKTWPSTYLSNLSVLCGCFVLYCTNYNNDIYYYIDKKKKIKNQWNV